MDRAVADRPYHHGDLRRALLDEAVAVIAAEGPSVLSLRDLARRIGVSHAAPAHHFGDKRGLLGAVAAEGFDLLATALEAAYEHRGDFLEVGLAYVRFAVDHPAHFEVMFRRDLYAADDEEVQAAERRAEAVLYGPIAALVPGADVVGVGVAAWSLVHGFATLWLSGNLPGLLGADADAAARRVVTKLFVKD
ncbi:MAG TPA: TetR/AcrR family transcriptional regulator [Acidimicrobiales bacterium]|nr:TetR/AcrR family transcriptional regulator [Acidimicrobiales bacterium]